MSRIKPGDIVLYENKEFEVENVKFNNGNPIVDLNSLEEYGIGYYYIPICDVKLIKTKEN